MCHKNMCENDEVETTGEYADEQECIPLEARRQVYQACLRPVFAMGWRHGP